MTGISTHVLDTARGIPARNVPIQLEQQQSSGSWQVIGSSRTDDHGRCNQLVSDGKRLVPGTYRLAFDTASYHSGQAVQGLYPIVHVTFSVREGETHFHIPLLLSPFGYTTYRGT